MKFYISDLHLCHENVIKHDHRPFKDIDEMNSELVSRWNNTVYPQDEVVQINENGICIPYFSPFSLIIRL